MRFDTLSDSDLEYMLDHGGDRWDWGPSPEAVLKELNRRKNPTDAEEILETEIPVRLQASADGNSTEIRFYEGGPEPAREAVLSSDLDGDPPYQIHGVALGPNDITRGQNGTKLWPASTLEKAASTLAGKNLVTDHDNSVHAVVGEITDAKFIEEVGVAFQGLLDSRDIAGKIQNDRIDVSARILHGPIEEMDADQESGAHIVQEAVFDNLSFVLKPGASKSNMVAIGAQSPIEVSALREAFN